MRHLTTPCSTAGRGISLQAAGFTLIELLCSMLICAVLASLTWPSFHGVILRVRRIDGLSALMHIQTAQEHYRAEHGRYANLAELHLPNASHQGHYHLSIKRPDADGYKLLAQAHGRQEADKPCRYLQLHVNGQNTIRSSGPTSALANDEVSNQRCWSS